MLTSRSEYRLILRQDNADLRLTEIGREVGLVSDARWQRFLDKKESIEKEKQRFLTQKISPDEEVNSVLAKYGENIDRGVRLSDIIKRPNITYDVLKELDPETKRLNLSKEIAEQVEIEFKYEGYIKRQSQQVEQLSKMEKIKIPKNFDFQSLEHVSQETKDKLSKINPVTLAQAARIGGVKPADISVLAVMIETHRYKLKV